MPIISIKSKGSFKKTEAFLALMKSEEIFAALDRYGREGVNALSNATPVDSGITAESWSYEVVRQRGRHALIFHNTHMVDGRPIAILLQYGHGTGTGGYVQGRDYINPVIRPLFDRIANEVWRAVTK